MSRHLMTEVHHTAIAQSNNHVELRLVAESILAIMDQPIGMVCGPISTGGLGSIEANERQFIQAIDTLIDLGYNIFDQMPYEPKMKEFVAEVKGYDYRILEHFYQPLFESGMIRTKFFIQGWESSTGAQWERSIAQKLGITIVDLDANFVPLV